MDKRETQVDTGGVPDSGTSLLILGTVADTTWRMFVPAAFFVGAGVWIDATTHAQPLWTLVGALCGFAVAVTLIWRQYKQVAQSKHTQHLGGSK